MTQNAARQFPYIAVSGPMVPPLGLAAYSAILVRVDLGPQSDQLNSHGDDLVGQQSLRICA